MTDYYILLACVLAFLCAYQVASWNAVRGSGRLANEDSVLKLVKAPIRLFTTPLFLAIGVYLLSSDIWLTVISLIPYYLKMFTGTGGDMQAQQNKFDNNPQYMQEWIVFDKIAMKLADLGIYKLPLCQQWGLWYCTLWAIIYSLPFMLTNYTYAIPVLLYPVFVRYLSWRKVEFYYLFTYSFVLMLSIIGGGYVY